MDSTRVRCVHVIVRTTPEFGAEALSCLALSSLQGGSAVSGSHAATLVATAAGWALASGNPGVHRMDVLGSMLALAGRIDCLAGLWITFSSPRTLLASLTGSTRHAT